MGLSESGGWQHNPMYDMGYHRVGCIGCPLATYKQKMKEFADFPVFKKHYIQAFDEMLKENRKKDPTKYGNWQCGEDVFNWWIEEYKHNTKGQMTIQDYMQDKVDDMGFIIRERPTESK